MNIVLPLSLYASRSVSNVPDEAHRFASKQDVTLAHVLLALLRWQLGTARKAFERLGVAADLQTARIKFAGLCKPDEEKVVAAEGVPLPQVLERAQAFAAEANALYVCTGAILLSLIALESPSLSALLEALGVQPDNLRRQIEEIGLGMEDQPESPPGTAKVRVA